MSVELLKVLALTAVVLGFAFHLHRKAVREDALLEPEKGEEEWNDLHW